MSKESGIKTPTRADLVRMDKKRKDKKLSNEDWQSTTDADARIARMKDKTTRMAYKPEHAVDLDTGAIVAAPVHHADRVDTKTVEATLEKAANTLELLEMKPSASAASWLNAAFSMFLIAKDNANPSCAALRMCKKATSSR